MAYSDIDNSELHFQAKIYTGNGGTQSITLDGSENMQPDWVWIKQRSETRGHNIQDSVRGATKYLDSRSNGAEATVSNTLTSFDSNGFSLGSYDDVNKNSQTYASWNWLAGGIAPAITYSVKVVSDSGNKYRFDDFGTSAVTLDLQEGGTYTFDQSDSSNSGHPLRFSTTSDGSHGGGSEYTTGVTTTGTPGNSGAKTVITLGSGVATLYYYCTQHSAMGGQANTNSTFGSSNFSGSIQANVSANNTAGFSIVSYTGTGSGATVGHGLSTTPNMMIIKNRPATDGRDWQVYSPVNDPTDALALNQTDPTGDSDVYWNDTAPTSSVFSVKAGATNKSGDAIIGYIFSERKGYSKFSTYVGNGSSSANSGSFVYTGFKPSLVIVKCTTSAEGWQIWDNKRSSFNGQGSNLSANSTGAESTGVRVHFFSNGYQLVSSGADQNSSGETFMYMAFAESPFVNSNGVPNNAR